MAGRSLFFIVIAVAMVAVVVGHAVPSPIQVYWETVLPNTPILEFIVSKFEPEVINDKTSTSMGGTTVNLGNEGINANRGKGMGRKGFGVDIERGKSGVKVDQGGVNVNTGPKAKAVIEKALPFFYDQFDGEGGVNANTSPKAKAVIEKALPFFYNQYDGEGGVNVNTSPKAKVVMENGQPDANLFLYHQYDGEGGVSVNTSPKAKVVMENAQPDAHLFLYHHYDGEGGVNANTSPKAKEVFKKAQPDACFHDQYNGERGVTSPRKAVIENVQPGANILLYKQYTGEGGAPEGKPMIENVQRRANLFSSSANHHHDDPNAALFFLEKDLHQGTKFNIFFPNTKSGPKFLPRNVVDAIPFSSAKISEILTHFSIDPTSLDAQTMMKTIKTCEMPEIREAKFCATSLESMIDFATSKLGTNIKALTTEIKEEAPKQQYTIAQGVRKKTSPKSVSCHIQAYVHAVYYCHETSNTATYVVPLVGEDKMKFDAAAVCHRDTSQWNPKHVAFQKLKVKPGSASICHFIPKDHIVWVQNW